MRNINTVDIRASDRFGDPVSHSADYQEYVFKCPYCNSRKGSPDEKGNLYVNNKSLAYYCFRCGAKGIISSNFELSQKEKSNEEMIKTLESILYSRSKKIKLLNYKIPVTRPMLGTLGYNYLISRGITESDILYYDIRESRELSGINSKRVIIPNQTINTYFESKTDMSVARYCGDDKKIPKYLNSKGGNRKYVVFNLFRIPERSPIIICEGALTAISAGRNAVATYGKYITKHQLNSILKKKPTRLYISLDPDAEKEAVELCDKLFKTTQIPIYLVKLPEKEDANSLGHKNYMKYLFKSKEYDPITNKIFSIV